MAPAVGGVPLRALAVVAAALFLLAALPPAQAGPVDECKGARTPTAFCHEFEVEHRGLPAINTLPYFDTYYLFVASAACTSAPFSTECSSSPAPGSGVPLPTGDGTVGVNRMPILYQETNGAPGLQRARVFSGIQYEADKTVLA
jgi:hypothetical protein